MAKSLYTQVGTLVEPVADLLKALAEVNQHKLRALNEDWRVMLRIDPDTGDVLVTIDRDGFPDLDAPEEPK